MIQKEMADRIVARPGTKDYGALGVMVRTYCDVSTVLKVGAGSFVPVPKIDSTVIKLVPLPNAEPRVPIADHAHYSQVVHAAFGPRRKTLRNAGPRGRIADPAPYWRVVPAAFGQRRKPLRNALRARLSDEQIDAALAATGIDGSRRGETLDIAEFGSLAAALPVVGHER